MHRRPLLDLIDVYERRHAGEAATAARIRELVREHATCFERTCVPGHVTASAFIVDAARERFLLTHHRKLDRWLQLGGHADGDPLPHRVALREAREESGLERFSFAADGDRIEPADLDVHRIPARRDEPEHWHHDVRYVLVAGAGQELRISEESHDLRWFGFDELDRVAGDESVHRLGRKAIALLRSPALRLIDADRA